MLYKEHSIAKKLKDSPISEYNPTWTKNTPNTVQVTKKKEIPEKVSKKKSKIDWETF